MPHGRTFSAVGDGAEGFAGAAGAGGLRRSGFRIVPVRYIVFSMQHLGFSAYDIDITKYYIDIST